MRRQEFFIGMPGAPKRGDYVQTTQRYEEEFGPGFFARIYGFTRIDEDGAYKLDVVMPNGDKRVIHEAWVNRIPKSAVHEYEKEGQEEHYPELPIFEDDEVDPLVEFMQEVQEAKRAEHDKQRKTNK